MKISVIGGGNMGGAIAFGAITQGVAEAREVTISHLSEKMRPLFGHFLPLVKLENRNCETITGSDFIVIAVKPWMVEQVIAEISESIDRERQAIISVVAGLSFEKMAEMLSFDALGAMPLYRVIPNTAISIGEGVSIISSFGSTTTLDSNVVRLFDALGSTFVVEESMMAPLTSLSSCGIAFALRFLDASKKGGQEVGIEEKLSLEVTLKTMMGAIAMLQKNGTQPQTEIDKVTTKGGITLKGLEAMEREGFSKAVACAIKESR
ncbi:MAG: pyrroline-5-carboxylate reductase dimerization domain-containing protein [Rikenellaceae bacterium]